jgi:hypothetical protein
VEAKYKETGNNWVTETTQTREKKRKEIPENGRKQERKAVLAFL